MFLSDVIKTDLFSFYHAAQRYMSVLVLEKHSVPMAEELCSFQFLDMNETVNRSMPFRALLQHSSSVSYQT